MYIDKYLSGGALTTEIIAGLPVATRRDDVTGFMYFHIGSSQGHKDSCSWERASC